MTADVSAGRFWLVDPLDATKEFVNHRDEFTVNIALVDNQTNTAFPAARLSLISGEVNRAAARRPPFQPVATRALAAAEIVADGVTLGATGPFYRYALPQTFDIRPRRSEPSGST